jgi:hypothetical protein
MRRRVRGCNRYTTTELTSAFRAALEELGADASRAQYADWREHRLSAGEDWPPAPWLEVRLGHGRWTEAKQRALT